MNTPAIAPLFEKKVGASEPVRPASEVGSAEGQEEDGPSYPKEDDPGLGLTKVTGGPVLIPELMVISGGNLRDMVWVPRGVLGDNVKLVLPK